MNVYIVEVSRRLAEPRRRGRRLHPRHLQRPAAGGRDGPGRARCGTSVAGPFEGLGKEDLPAQLCAFTAAVLREEAQHEPGYYDLVHSHYWLSGQVGWLARDRWGVPLVHTAHTLAKVKNAALADGDRPEPLARRDRRGAGRRRGRPADRQHRRGGPPAGRSLYGADPARTGRRPARRRPRAVPPGRPRRGPDRASGMPADAVVLLFVGRIQPLKAPDVLLRAAAGCSPRCRSCATGCRCTSSAPPAAPAWTRPSSCSKLAADLGIADVVRFVPPQPPERLADYYRAADVAVVPSHNESFGLVALEAQACGTPVVAAAVGGLPTAVRDGVSGVLVDGARPARLRRRGRALVARAGRGAARRRRPPARRARSPGTAPPTRSAAYAYRGATGRAPRPPAGVGRCAPCRVQVAR